MNHRLRVVPDFGPFQFHSLRMDERLYKPSSGPPSRSETGTRRTATACSDSDHFQSRCVSLMIWSSVLGPLKLLIKPLARTAGICLASNLSYLSNIISEHR